MGLDHPSMDTPTLGPKATQSIIDPYAPFNQRDSSVARILDLYPTLLLESVVDPTEEYSIPFLGHMDRKSFQCVAEDGMYIHNHDFNVMTKLV